MKYYFIMNPVTGSSDKTAILTKEVETAFKKYPMHQYEIYVTKTKGDGMRFVREVSSKITEDTVFIACGGDGTTYEVLNGIKNFDKSILGVISVGSCNDFLKCFKEQDFRTIEKCINVEPRNIDIIKCNNSYALNEVNIGFDAMVNDDCNRIKERTKNVKTAYNRAIFKNIILKKTPYALVVVDEEKFYEGKILLMTFANGKYYGGGYKAAPNAIVDDGLLETLVVKNISRVRFVMLVKDYKAGTHLEKKKFKSIIHYARSKKIRIKFNKDACICLDGEISYNNRVDIEIEPAKLKFIIPGV